MNLLKINGVDVNDLSEKQSNEPIECFVNLDEIKAIMLDGDVGHISFISGGEMAITRKSVNLIRRNACTTSKERMAVLKTIQSEYYEKYVEEHSADTPVNNLTKSLAEQVSALMSEALTEKEALGITEDYPALGYEFIGVDNITAQIGKLAEIMDAMSNNKLPRVIFVTKEDALELVNAFFMQQQNEGYESFAKKTRDVYLKFLAKYSKPEQSKEEERGKTNE